MAILICYKQFCPYRDRQEGVYQKAFLTAKFAKKLQKSQRANYPVAFFAVILNH